MDPFASHGDYSHGDYPNQFPDHLNPPDYPLYSHPHLPHHLYHPVHDDMPRPSFFSYSPDVIKHRKRTSRSQRKVLEEAFRSNPKPSQYTRKLLIHQTGMERRAIQVWFQNRRAKEKKLAAKANATGGIDPGVKHDPADDSDGDADDDDQNPTEGPGSPAATAAAQHDMMHHHEDDTAAATTANGSASDDSSDQATPSPHNASTPAATTSGSSNSPRPSTNGAPSPPSLWRSPALGPKGHLETEYAFRRESAPAPLGANFPRPPPFIAQSFIPHGEEHDTVTIWDGGTPPSPLSANEEILNLRRGSLPAFSSHNEMAGLPSNHLSGLTPDPNLRRMSLERSRQRLASHPYAHRVMSTANRGFPLPHEHFVTGPQNSRPAFLHAATAPSEVHMQVPAQMPLETGQQNGINWDPRTDSTFPSYVRPRRYGSCQIGMDTAPYRTRTEIVPGPLPAPGFSFGTAPTAISETDGDDDETNTGTSLSLEDMHRFGSFASTTSSTTSAWFSDVPSNPVDDFPTTWQPDHRRASCPAPSFMNSFSGLQVSNEAPPLDNCQPPNFNSSELALALDVTKATVPHDGEPAISVEDPSPVAHETQMQAKMQGAGVTGYPENVGYYQDAFPGANAGYTDPFAYTALTGYELNPTCVDTTPTASNATGVPYQFHQ